MRVMFPRSLMYYSLFDYYEQVYPQALVWTNNRKNSDPGVKCRTSHFHKFFKIKNKASTNSKSHEANKSSWKKKQISNKILHSWFNSWCVFHDYRDSFLHKQIILSTYFSYIMVGVYPVFVILIYMKLFFTSPLSRGNLFAQSLTSRALLYSK